MDKELHTVEFYYEEHLIGIGYNLSENDADKLWGQWEEHGDNYWCAIIYEVEENE